MRCGSRTLVHAIPLALAVCHGGAVASAGVTHAVPDSASPVRMSADGRYVAYARAISTPFGPLPPGIDCLDRETGAITEVAPVRIGPAGVLDLNVPGDMSAFKGLSLSANGRVVAFASGNTSLVLPDDNGSMWDVYVRDLDTGVISRVSVSSAGVQANGQSAFPALSADGRYVVFSSDASNLVAGDTNGRLDVFVHDRATGTTERVNVASDGSQSVGDISSINQNTPLSFCHCPAISADGRYVAFWSLASDLVPGDTNGNFDAFVHDRVTGQTTRASVKSDGSESHPVVGPVHVGLSGDGRFVAFESRTNDLDPRKTTPPNVQGVFVHDQLTGVTELASLNSDGESANALASGDPHLSYDGRFVTFQSTADNLVPDDTNGQVDVFLRDRQLGTTVRVDVSSTGVAAGETVETLYQTSDDGRFVSFQTYTDLDPDTFGDAYVRDLTCANGVTEGSESCDDGNLIDTDSCDTSCRPTGCPPAVCGDGVVSGCEECDDGNAVTGDCCTASCTFQGRGSGCADEGNVCTADACDGAGSCAHPNRVAGFPCDDDIFCDGADRCSGGACSVHTGNPCTAGGVCAGTCDEANDGCTSDAVPCTDDGNPCTLDECDGTVGCMHPPAPAGTPCPSDGIACTADECDGNGVCGHAVLGDGTTCDDGNVCTTGETCHAGQCGGGAPVGCPFCERCDPVGGCSEGPRTNCKAPTSSRRAQLLLQDRTPDDRDLVRWKWTRGERTTFAELGDPLTADGYGLCVYDAGAALLLRMTAPAAAMCGAVPCWRQLGRAVPTGYKYTDRARLSDGVDTLTLKSGEARLAKVTLKGKGENVPMPALGGLALPLTVQLHGENGVCFEARFSQAGVQESTSDVFRGRSE